MSTSTASRFSSSQLRSKWSPCNFYRPSSALWKVRDPVTKELRNHFDGELFRFCWFWKYWSSKLSLKLSITCHSMLKVFPKKNQCSLEKNHVFCSFVTCFIGPYLKSVLATCSRFCSSGSHIVEFYEIWHQTRKNKQFPNITCMLWLGHKYSSSAPCYVHHAQHWYTLIRKSWWKYVVMVAKGFWIYSIPRFPRNY